VSGESLAEAIQAVRGGRVEYAGSMEEAVARLVKDARAGEMVLTLGAGSVSAAGGMVLEGLKTGE
jgi:UDP-N-acetylmuramate--alanine ligase